MGLLLCESLLNPLLAIFKLNLLLILLNSRGRRDAFPWEDTRGCGSTSDHWWWWDIFELNLWWWRQSQVGTGDLSQSEDWFLLQAWMVVCLFGFVWVFNRFKVPFNLNCILFWVLGLLSWEARWFRERSIIYVRVFLLRRFFIQGFNLAKQATWVLRFDLSLIIIIHCPCLSRYSGFRLSRDSIGQLYRLFMGLESAFYAHSFFLNWVLVIEFNLRRANWGTSGRKFGDISYQVGPPGVDIKAKVDWGIVRQSILRLFSTGISGGT